VEGEAGGEAAVAEELNSPQNGGEIFTQSSKGREENLETWFETRDSAFLCELGGFA
jgi:hypothetical protein